jgi:hypothetical protein
VQKQEDQGARAGRSANRGSAARSNRIAIITFAVVEAIFIGAAVLTSMLR